MHLLRPERNLAAGNNGGDGAAVRTEEAKDAGHQIALFRIAGPGWTPAAKGNLNHRSEAASARIDPAHISDALFS